MLTIRMQRLGRKGHPTYRVVVQDVRQTPTSGKYVALLGNYDPHAKTTTLSREKAEFYLKNGAQPSDRVIRLFTTEGIKLPGWVKMPTERKREIRKADKLRKNRPAEEAPAEDAPEKPKEAPAESASETSEETPAEETKS
jgi:small subunit ribosomal protein S16